MNEEHNFIPQLVKLVPPPPDPTDTNQTSQWNAMQEDLGTTLPNDLRELCATYGSGRFEDPSGMLSITVHNPFARRYKRDVSWKQKILRYHKSMFNVFPCSPGLLSWGSDDSRRIFCWLTDGVPDSWPVIFITAEHKFLQFNTSFSGFLVQLLSGQIDDYGADMTGEWFREREGEFLFKSAKPYDPSRWHPLWEAVLMLDREKTRQLLSEGVDPDTLMSGDTPIFGAIEHVCDIELVELLLAAGANPNVHGEEGRTPLHLAAYSDYEPRFVELLLSAGADVSSKDLDGWSALLWACNRKFEDRVRLLLEHGADPNDRLPDGTTALHLARQSKSVCEMLKEAGATE